MNAVERMLAQGEQLLSLYDEMYRERLGPRRDPALPDVPQGLIHSVGGIVIDGMPAGQYWASSHWLQAAAETAWFELVKPRKQPTRDELVARAAVLFREYLAQREQLLSDATWRRLLADVVYESRSWEPLSAKLVALAEQVCEAVKGVSLLDGSMEPRWWRHDRISTHVKPLSITTSPAKRTSLRQALDLLHPYSRPPATAATPEKQTGSSSRRQPAGGRPKKWPASLRRAIIADRRREERKKHPEPLKTWLTSWATKHDMKRADALKMYNAETVAIRRAERARSN